MLASTVQFSNNDQTPTLDDPKTASHETGTEETDHTAVPSGPNNVPDTPASALFSTPKQY
nr:hypothetical protein KPHV_69790 [Kitasatospora purpeofusca]